MTDYWYTRPCPVPDEDMRRQALARQQVLTKPPGSLGRVEELAVELSAMQGRAQPAVERVGIAVFAGDHGVAAEGVSAFPQAVTGEMIRNFTRGGAAISVLARHTGSLLRVINMGTVDGAQYESPVIHRAVAPGTGNLARAPAMTPGQCEDALAAGREVVEEHYPDRDLLIGGEMGIANTTSATALAAALGLGPVASLAGPGTGLDAPGLRGKIGVIEKGLARCGDAVDAGDPVRILVELGGLEIAALAGFYIHGAQRGMAILVDGFISSVAALLACRINPGARPWLMFSHRSAEPGHAAVLEALSAQPLLALNMRLGEGSGAALAVELLRCACALHNQMATFAEAGVSDAN